MITSVVRRALVDVGALGSVQRDDVALVNDTQADRALLENKINTLLKNPFLGFS